MAGEYPNFEFDYSKIQIGSSDLPVPIGVQLRHALEAGSATFRWGPDGTKTSQSGNGNDKVYIVWFNVDLPAEGTLKEPATHVNGEAIVELPAEWKTGSTYFWLYFASPDLQKNSNSLYLKIE